MSLNNIYVLFIKVAIKKNPDPKKEKRKSNQKANRETKKKTIRLIPNKKEGKKKPDPKNKKTGAPGWHSG